MKHYPTLPVNELRPHPGPHLDEVCEAVFARRYGKAFFPGVETAKVNPFPADASEEDSLNKGILLLGQGRALFDDKGPDGKRIPGTCCALRMADYIGIRSMTQLDKLFRAVNRVDGTATATSLDLSRIMKDGIESSPEKLHPAIFAWGEKGVNSVIDHLILCEEAKTSGTKIDYTGWVRPSAILEAMISRRDITDRSIIDRLRKLVSSSEKQTDNCIELAAVSRAMKATGVPGKDVVDWIHSGLHYTAQQQEQYQEAIREIRAKGKVADLDPRYDGDKMTLLVIETENPQVAKASRSQQFQDALCLVIRPSGNMAILPNSSNKLDMGAVWALIRMHETPPELRHAADFAKYSAAGNLPEVPHWHAMDSGPFLNGSNHIPAKKTELPEKTIVDCIKIGFTDEAVKLFNTMRGGNGVLSESESSYLAQAHAKYSELAAVHEKFKEHAAPVVSPIAPLDKGARSILERALDKK